MPMSKNQDVSIYPIPILLPISIILVQVKFSMVNKDIFMDIWKLIPIEVLGTLLDVGLGNLWK